MVILLRSSSCLSCLRAVFLNPRPSNPQLFYPKAQHNPQRTPFLEQGLKLLSLLCGGFKRQQEISRFLNKEISIHPKTLYLYIPNPKTSHKLTNTGGENCNKEPQNSIGNHLSPYSIQPLRAHRESFIKQGRLESRLYRGCPD